MTIPVATDASLTAAVNNYNSLVTSGTATQAQIDAAEELCNMLRNQQYSLNVTDLAATILSLADQLEVARAVQVRLIELGNSTNSGECIGPFTVDAANAAAAAERTWLGTRIAANAASVESQVASVVASVP